MTKDNLRKTALITGGTGYIGSKLANHLLSQGWNVAVIVRPDSSLDLLRDKLTLIKIYEYDGTMESMDTIVSESKPTVVFHLASLFLARHQANDVDPLIQSNILLGTQLVEAMILHHIPYLVNTGTAWQHYQDQPYNPVCLYAATKQAYESILKYYIETSPLKVITLKLFDTYGPDDPRPKIIPKLLNLIQNEKELDMSPGEQQLDLVHVDDVVRAFVTAAEFIVKPSTPQWSEYTVSTGHYISLKELVHLFELIANKNIRVNWGKRSYRLREVMTPWGRGERLPGWEQKIPLEEGIRNIYFNNKK